MNVSFFRYYFLLLITITHRLHLPLSAVYFENDEGLRSKWTDIDLFAWCATPVTAISARIFFFFWFPFSLSFCLWRNEKALPCELARAWRKRTSEHRVHRPIQGHGNPTFLLFLEYRSYFANSLSLYFFEIQYMEI